MFIDDEETKKILVYVNGDKKRRRMLYLQIAIVLLVLVSIIGVYVT